MRFTVFYGLQIYAEYEDAREMYKSTLEMPDGVYIHDGSPALPSMTPWFNKHMHDIKSEDVPAELKMLQLLLNL